MQIPVLKIREDATTELHSIRMEDVLYICVENRTLVYHTADDAYRHISTLSDWEEHLAAYGFDMTDKTNLVNIRKIKKLDSKTGKLYFDEHPTKKSKFASIAFIKQKLFKKLILRAIADNTNACLQYAMKPTHAKAPFKEGEAESK